MSALTTGETPVVPVVPVLPWLETLARDRRKLAGGRGKGVNECDVVSELKRSEVGKDDLVVTYDNKALKRDLAGTDEGREHLAAFGLLPTEPQKHAEVKAL